MGQNFFPDTINQTLLFAPSLHDWLPEGHLARFLVDVVSSLDLSAIYQSYRQKDGRGQAAYAPEVMARLLLYGYANGVYNSRKIQTRTYEDVAFRYLSGDQHPDHSTIAEFRARHLEALSGLFTQALLLCSKVPDGGNKGSFVQGYNAQIAVDSHAQVIVAAEVTQETNDKQQLVPMIAQIAVNLDRKPEKVSADTGYFSAANVTDEQVKVVDLYVATGRDKHGSTVEICKDSPPDAPPKEAMRDKLRTEAGRAVYKMRKAIVEPVFGQIKEQRGFRRFSLRGKQKVGCEWRLACAASNLLKLFRSGWVPQTA